MIGISVGWQSYRSGGAHGNQVRRMIVETIMHSRLLLSACVAGLVVVLAGCGESGMAMSASPDRAQILAAAVGADAPVVQRGDRSVKLLNVVERFGKADDNRLRPDPSSELLSPADRLAIARSLDGWDVNWVEDFGTALAGPPSSASVDTGVRLTAILSVPRLDGARATVSIEFRCGAHCHSGVTMFVERDSSGQWTRLVGSSGGFIE